MHRVVLKGEESGYRNVLSQRMERKEIKMLETGITSCVYQYVLLHERCMCIYFQIHQNTQTLNVSMYENTRAVQFDCLNQCFLF